MTEAWIEDAFTQRAQRGDRAAADDYEHWIGSIYPDPEMPDPYPPQIDTSNTDEIRRLMLLAAIAAVEIGLAAVTGAAVETGGSEWRGDVLLAEMAASMGVKL